MTMIDYRKIATQNPDLVAPWCQTERALYFRTRRQACEWAEEFGGVVSDRKVLIDDATGEREDG